MCFLTKNKPPAAPVFSAINPVINSNEPLQFNRFTFSKNNKIISNVKMNSQAKLSFETVIIVLLFLLRGISLAEPPSTRYQETIFSGINCIYNYNFTRAESIFVQITRDTTADYLGYFYLAMLEWNKNQICNRNKRIVHRGIQYLDSTIRSCRRKLKKDPGKEKEYLFYLAGAQGYKGIFYMLQKNYFKAGIHGKRGHSGFVKLIKKYPEEYDGYLGLGIFDYYADLVPFYVKMLRFLLALPPGSRERGLQEIQKCADKGRFARREAEIMYTYLSMYYEKRYRETLPLARNLSRQYPNNLILLSRLIETLFQLDSLETVGKMEANYQEKTKQFRRRYPEICLDSFMFYEVEYDFGLCNFLNRKYSKALSYLNHYLETLSEDSPPEKIARAHLILGQIYDVIGMRSRAQEEYGQVLKMRNFKTMKSEARKYLKTPYHP